MIFFLESDFEVSYFDVTILITKKLHLSLNNSVYTILFYINNLARIKAINLNMQKF